MDVRLGVAIDGASARLTLMEETPPHAVIDRSLLDLPGDPTEALCSTVLSTDRLLAESGHRLTATSVLSSDTDTAARVRDVLASGGLAGVTTVSRSEAITEATRSVVGDSTAASLVSDTDTAALSIVDAASDTTSLIAVEPIVNGDRGAAYRTLLQRLGEEPGGATSVILLDAPFDQTVTDELVRTSPVPLRFLDEPDFALSHGAALAAVRQRAGLGVAAGGSQLDSAATEVSPQVGQLAYSQVDDAADPAYVPAAQSMQMPMAPLSAFGENDYEEVEVEEDDAAGRPPRTLLLGSTIAAVVVVGFAALAVSVALNMKPEVREQTVPLADESIAGKYFPTTPGQGVVPDGPAWTMIEQLPPPGENPDARTFKPRILNTSSVSGGDTGELVQFYRDGTIGVTPPEPPGGGRPIIDDPVDVGFVGPQPNDYLTRLIPDFSRWSPCQVLSLVSNMTRMAQAAADVATGGFNDPYLRVDRFNGPRLDQLGEIAVVPVGKGNLFTTANTAVDSGTDTSAIPPEIFDASRGPDAASDVLPEDTKIIAATALDPAPSSSGAGSPESTPVLGQVLPPDVGKSLPGITGTQPIETPITGPSTPESSVPDDAVKAGLPEGSLPGGSLPEGSLPGGSLPDVTLPGGGSTADAPEIKSAEPIIPPGDAPKKLPGSTLDVLPTPKLDIPTPRVEAPAPTPEVVIPTPKIEVPKPEVEIPTPQYDPPAPEFDIPTPEVEIPQPPVFEPPTFEAPAPPTFDIPTQLIPTPSAPQIELPSLDDGPSVQTPPTLPQLPDLGDLFG